MFDVRKLKEPGVKSTFILQLKNKFQALADAEEHTPSGTNDINTMWEKIRIAYHRPAKPAGDANSRKGRNGLQQIHGKPLRTGEP